MIDLPIDLLVAHLDPVVLGAKLILISTAIAFAIATSDRAQVLLLK